MSLCVRLLIASLLIATPLLCGAARAESLIAQVERELDAAAARLPAQLRGRSVYVEIGLGPKAASEATFIGETLARFNRLFNLYWRWTRPHHAFKDFMAAETSKDGAVARVEREIFVAAG